MDRQHRKDLKTDKFAEEVGHTYQFLAEHRDKVKLYGIIALVVVLAGAAYYFYSGRQARIRQEALAAANSVDDGTVGAQVQPPLPNFPTQEAKDKARTAAYADVASKYPGSQEAAIAQMYLASAKAEKAEFADAEKLYRAVVDNAPAAYVSVATIALADVLSAEGKNADAEKLLRDLVNHPTPFVSKEEATIHLAEIVAKTNPTEARKILEPLRTARSAISRAAIEALGKLPPATSAN